MAINTSIVEDMFLIFNSSLFVFISIIFLYKCIYCTIRINSLKVLFEESSRSIWRCSTLIYSHALLGMKECIIVLPGNI